MDKISVTFLVIVFLHFFPHFCKIMNTNFLCFCYLLVYRLGNFTVSKSSRNFFISTYVECRLNRRQVIKWGTLVLGYLWQIIKLKKCSNITSWLPTNSTGIFSALRPPFLVETATYHIKLAQSVKVRNSYNSWNVTCRKFYQVLI